MDAMLCVSHTGCWWRFLTESIGPWTRVWSQFRRWSRKGTWARELTVVHAAAREAAGRTEATPSMAVIDTHVARGVSNGGFTFPDRGGPNGRTKGAKRIVAVDVTGLPPALWDASMTSSYAESGGTTRSRCSAPSGTRGVSRSPTDASAVRRLAKSFKNTTSSATGSLQAACIASTLRHLARTQAGRRALPSAA